MEVLEQSKKNRAKMKQEIITQEILHLQTPVFISRPLSHLVNKTILLKMECFQPIGSFKIRGIGRLAQELVSKGHHHLVSSSGGNAGLAVTYAAQKLGVKATVFVPKSTHKIYLENLKLAGANVVIAGDVWDEAHQVAMEFVSQNKSAYIPPFDHPTLWAGHSTMIDEIVQQTAKPDAIIASVGGGGLMCGILEGLERHGWSDVALFSAETEGAASFAASVEAGTLITLDKINTVATSLGAKRVCTKLFEWSQQRIITPLVMSDYEAVLACRKFVDNHRILVEPACGAALSTIYDIRNFDALKPYERIMIIVCGGVGMSYELMQYYLSHLSPTQSE